MSHNAYTSPRLFKSKTTPCSKYRRSKEQGIGYVVPSNVSTNEFRSLYAHWEQKLRKSGFVDIEYRNAAQTGQFTPFFRQNGSTTTFMRAYDPAKEAYYRLTRIFLNEFDFEAAFNDRALMYKTLWYLHSDGIPYRAVAKAFSGIECSWSSKHEPVPSELIEARSVYWAHDHTHKVLEHFWPWVKTYDENAE